MPDQSVRDLMTPDPTCCMPQTPVNEVARLMVQEDCGLIPIVENEQNRRLLGVVTDRDIVLRVVAKDLDPSTTQVGEVMSKHIARLRPTATVNNCVQVMADEQVRRVPIVDENDRIIGIVAQADLARASAQNEELEDELAEAVEEISEPSLG
jgi:CBS domain-containing protein